MMDDVFFRDFGKLRKRLNDCIWWIKEQGEPGKSYEGAWEITFGIPDAIDDPEAVKGPDYCKITLHCYLVGPGRHYDWKGKTPNEALKKCKADVEKWIKAEYDGWSEEGE